MYNFSYFYIKLYILLFLTKKDLILIINDKNVKNKKIIYISNYVI